MSSSDSLDTPITTSICSVYTYNLFFSDDSIVPESELARSEQGLPELGKMELGRGEADRESRVLGVAKPEYPAVIHTPSYTDHVYWSHPDRERFVNFICFFVPGYREMFFDFGRCADEPRIAQQLQEITHVQGI